MISSWNDEQWGNHGVGIEQDKYCVQKGKLSLNLTDLSQMVSLPVAGCNTTIQGRKNKRMNIDQVPWVIRAIIIVVAIILAIIIWKGKKGGRYQKYYLRFFVIGTTAFAMGIILLILSFITDLFGDYGLYLTSAGAISLIIGLVIRNTWEKNR